MSRVGAAAGAIVLACVLAPTRAQQASQPIPRFRTTVDLVLLDVSVLDRDRMPVRGLTAADFSVLEDGRPQKIATFSAVDLPAVVTTTETSASWMRQVAPDVVRNTDFEDRRIVTIVMDDATPMPAPDIPRAKAAARRVIEELGPRDLAAVVFAFNKSHGQEMTQDRSRLLAAVERFNGAVDVVWHLDKDGNVRIVPFDEFDGANLTLYSAVLNTLTGVADGLATLPDRRKALVLVSVGIPLEFDAAAPALIDESSVDKNGATHEVIRRLLDSFRAAQNANVNIYAIDTGGLRAPNDLGLPGLLQTPLGLVTRPASETARRAFDAGRVNREFLQAVAENTGGFTVTFTNDPGPGIKQVFRENASYYLLGYAQANRRQDGRFRRIEVRVNRPDVTVRTRTGYFEPDAAKKAATAPRRASIDEALSGPLPKADLTLQMTAAPFAVPNSQRAAVAVVLGVHQPAPPGITRGVQRIAFTVAAVSPGGRWRAGRHETVEATLNMRADATAFGYETFARLNLEPGHYSLRLAAESTLRAAGAALAAGQPPAQSPAEDAASRVGSVFCDLDVPDFVNDRLAMSGAVLSVTPPVVSGPKERFASLLPVVPTSLREFLEGDRVTAFVRIYQGRKTGREAVLMTWRVVTGSGVIAAEKSETVEAGRFSENRAVDYLFDLPITLLKPGAHLLTIEAKLDDKVVHRDVRFDVLPSGRCW